MPRVIFVHGTWGSGFWRGMIPAMFRNNLREWRCTWPIRSLLQTAGLEVFEFNWTGHNSHRSRLEAGRNLAMLVSSLRNQSSKPIWVVAHSHGGNVALYALRDLGAADIQKLVFLATPFLHCSPQVYDWKTFNHLLTFVSLAVYVFGIWLFLSTAHVALDIHPNILTVLASVVVSFGLLFVLSTARDWRNSLTIRLTRRIERACQEAQPPPPPAQCETLIFRKAGDEAFSLLEASRFGEWLLAAMWSLLSKTVDMPLRGIRKLVGWLSGSKLSRKLQVYVDAFDLSYYAWTAFVLLLLAFGVLLFFPERFLADQLRDVRSIVFELVGRCAWYLFAITVGSICAVAALQLVLIAGIALIGSIRLGIGLPGAAAIRFTTESTPLGAWTTRLSSSSGFAHSAVYEDRLLAEEIFACLMKRDRPELREAGIQRG